MFKNNKNYILIFSLAIVLRLLFFTFQNTWDPAVLENKIMPMGTDERGYHQLAIVLVDYGKLSFKPNLPPTALRTPIYPMFISSVYLIFGQHPWVVILFQNLIDSLTAVLVYLTFSSFFNQKAGWISGILYAIEPHMIFYSNSLFSDTLFTFFLALFFIFLINHLIKSDIKITPLIYSAISLGLAVLVKPAAVYLPILVILVLLFYLRKSFKRGLKFSIVFLLFYLLTISPWLIRNKIHYGEFFLSNSGEYNLLAINITPMEIPRKGKPQHVVERELRMEADSLMLANGVKPHWNKEPKDYWESLHLQVDYNKTKYWQKLAIEYIKKDPLNFVKFYALGLMHTLFNVGSTSFAENLNLLKKGNKINLKTEPNLFNLIKRFFTEKSLAEIILGFFISVYLFIVYLSFLIGLIKIIKSENRFLYFIPVLFALYFIMIAGAGGLARFKMPAVPFYIGISAFGLSFIKLLRERFVKI